MFRIKLEQKKKRRRTENWSQDEIALLRKLVMERYSIIENKKVDTITNTLKSEAWRQIWESFVRKNRCPRTVQNIRDQWKRIKCKKALLNKNHNNTDNIKEDNSENHSEQQNGDPLSLEDSDEQPNNSDFKSASETHSSQNPPTTRRIITQLLQAQKGGVEYKRSLLELNKIVKEQLTNCALEEHRLRLQQLKEEHELKLRTMNELHSLESENKRLQAQLLRLDIELRKKQLNNFVII